VFDKCTGAGLRVWRETIELSKGITCVDKRMLLPFASKPEKKLSQNFGRFNVNPFIIRQERAPLGYEAMLR